MQSEGIGGILIEAGLLGQRILFATLAFEGAIDYQIEHAVARGREGQQGLAHQPLQRPRPGPPPSGEQPAQVPGGHPAWNIAGQPLQGGFLKTHQMRHHQPAKDGIVTIAEVGLEGGKQTRYFLRQPAEPDHGWPPLERLKMERIHPSLYSWGGWPASSPLTLLRRRRGGKIQDNHSVTHFKLSRLSKLKKSTAFSADILRLS